MTWTVQDESSVADKHVIYLSAKFRIISEHDTIC